MIKIINLVCQYEILALQKLGYTEIPDDWVKIANELSEDEKKLFIIVDNVMFGEWVFNKLKKTGIR